MELPKTWPALTLVSALALVGQGATAQPQQPRPAPVHTAASKDPAAASAGQYTLDPTHTAVVLRILHEGSSYSIFRFNTVAGVLAWDPAKVESSRVQITVDPGSITTPVPKFADMLTGSMFLNAAAFPEIKFASTGVVRTGPTSGDITGDLTLLGKTRPVVIHGELVGVGRSLRFGTPTIGFTGSTKFKRSDFGLTALIPAVGDEAEIQIETEFDTAT